MKLLLVAGLLLRVPVKCMSVHIAHVWHVGLGETCTHITAILFYLEATARIQGTTITCT